MNTPASFKNHERCIMVIAIILAAIGPFCADSYLPSLPSMAHLLNSSENMMQLTITLYMLGFSLSQLVYGPLSDKLGRRKVILIGLSICMIGSVFCALANTATTLLMARFIQGCGIGVCNSLYRAIMRDTFTGERMSQMASYVGMLFALAPIIAPLTGGYIQMYLGWRANFIFLALLITCVWMIIWYWLPETNKKLDPNATRIKVVTRNYFILLTNRAFISHAALASLGVAAIIAYLATSPFLFQTILELSPVQYAWLAIYSTIGTLCGQFLNAIFVKKFGMKKMMLFGITIALISSVVMLSLSLLGFINILVIMVPWLFFIFGVCLIFANAMTSAFHPFAHIAGAAGALYGCLQIIGAVITSLLMASIVEINQTPLACVLLFISSTALAIFYFILLISNVKNFLFFNFLPS
jgi:Bcr/CflA subfamily drug resistance transporter